MKNADRQASNNHPIGIESRQLNPERREKDPPK
jgi:hypothetical protein